MVSRTVYAAMANPTLTRPAKTTAAMLPATPFGASEELLLDPDEAALDVAEGDDPPLPDREAPPEPALFEVVAAVDDVGAEEVVEVVGAGRVSV